jgi:FtsP/CotA-like multicopper oxidase with cupredoxin domain
LKSNKFQYSRVAKAAMIAIAAPFAAQVAMANGGGIGLAADGSPVQTYYANTYVSNADGKDGTANAVRGLRKFIDTLPGVAMPGGTTGVLGGINNLGQYLPLAIADTASYFNSDYYEIAVVEYAEKMHSDLVKPTTLRGYVQIDRAMTNAATVNPAEVTAYNQYLVALNAYNAKLAAYQAYTKAAAANVAAASGLAAAQLGYTPLWTAYNQDVLALQTWTNTNNQYNAAVNGKTPADALLQTCATLINTANPAGGNFGYLCPSLGGWPTGVTLSVNAGVWSLSAPFTYSYTNASGATVSASYSLVANTTPPTVGLPAAAVGAAPTPVAPAVPTYIYTDPVSNTLVTSAYVTNLLTGVLSNPTVPAVVAVPGTAPTVVSPPTAVVGTPSTNSKGIPLTYPDGSPIMVNKENADHSLAKDATGSLIQVQAYGYDKPHYLGPVILASKGKAVRMKYVNALPSGRAVTNADGSVTRNGDLFLPVDETLTGAGFGPDGATMYTENRTALHWHGGDTPWISDGTPHQWITPAADELSLPVGYKRGVSQANVPDMPEPGPGAETLYWPNNMGARLMFYHDHALAITRLNVYGGTAAGYVLTDKVEDALTTATGTTTTLSGADTIDGLSHSVKGAGLPGLLDEIPLVIQDKTFVPADVAQQDALWDTKHWGTEGDLWYPHVYEINQNPAMTGDGTNPVGRWDYGPWFWPVFPAPLQLPTGAYGDVTTVPEGFMDTPIVNGTAYPTVTVDPKAYRLRILNAANDRILNLSFFVADPTVTTADGRTGTEVKMVPFISPNGVTQVTYACPDGVTAGQTVGTKNANGTILAPGWTESGPTAAGNTLYPNSFPCAGGLNGTGWGQSDNRPGGVPFPGVPNPDGSYNSNVSGPHFIQIGNEGGLLPNPVDIPPNVVNYEYNKRSVTVLNVFERGLFLGGAERADTVVDFSAYAGKTLIMYNDSPAPLPAGDPRIDYYTDDGDQTGAGGAPNTLAGFGPNTRTVMQFVVNATAATPAAAFTLGAPATGATAATGLYAALPTAYAASQEKPFVTESAYNNAFGTTNGDSYGTIFAGSSIQPNFVFTPTTTATQTLQSISLTGQGVGYTVAPTVVLSGGGLANPITIASSATQGAQIAGGKVTSIILPQSFISQATGLKTAPTVKLVSNANASGITVGQGASAMAFTNQTVSAPAQMKAIQELFDPSFGRMNATLGVELPFTSPLNQTTIPLGYIDPTTENIPEDQIQIWKITHNGVDTHPVHFHLFNLQVINRVGWDGTIKPPYDNEQGWKETLKMNPLEDVYVAVKPRTPMMPFGVGYSERLMDPSQPAGAITGFTQVDPLTGGAPVNPATGLTVQVTNQLKSYGWEYVWHCHILGHEENDFMRPINFAYVSVIPDAPTGLTAAAAVAPATGNVLSWADPTAFNAATTPGNKKNEIGFRVLRAASGSAVFTEVTGSPTLSNATTFTDTTAVSGTPYQYEVVAFNQAGTSIAATVAAGGATAAPAPTAPSNAVATVGNAYQISLAWRDNSNQLPAAETGFVIQRAVVTGNVIGAYSTIATAPAVAGSGTTLTYADTTVQPSTTYSYRVAAANGATLSTFAVASNKSTGTAPDLKAPSNLTVQMTGANTATATFNDLATGENLYLVQVSTDSGKTWGDGTLTNATAQTGAAYAAWKSGANATGSALTIDIPGNTNTHPSPANLALNQARVYLFRVAAANGARAAGSFVDPVAGTTTAYNTTSSTTLVGPWSNVDTLDLSGATVVAPAAGLKAAPSSATTATLAWQDVSNNNSGYELQYLLGGVWTNVTIGGGVGVRIPAALAGAATSVTVSGLTSGATYQFRLRAVLTGSVTAQSSYATVDLTMALPAVPAAPSFAIGSATTTGLTLNWAAVPGAATYGIQRSATGAAPWTNTTPATSTTNSLAVTGLTSNTNYFFDVLATNGIGSSPYSPASVAMVTLPVQANPTTTNVTDTSLTLNWAAPAGNGTITGYTVTGTGGTISYTPGTRTATVTGLSASTAYTFTVVASNAAGSSAAANVLVTTALAVPTAPTVSGLTATGLTLNWAAVAGATSYGVQRATVTNGVIGNWGNTTTINAVAGVVPTSLAVTGLTAGTTYVFHVRDTTAAGTSGYSAPSANATTLAAMPATPTVTATGVSATGFTLNFATTNATSYNVTVGGATTNQVASTLAVTGLAGNTSYGPYTVAACSNGGTTCSAASANLTPLTLPGLPTGLVLTSANRTTPTATTDTVTLTFTAPTGGAASYVVQRATGLNATTGFTTQNTVTTTVNADGTVTIVQTGVARGATTSTTRSAYTYQVAARNATGTTTYVPVNVTTN